MIKYLKHSEIDKQLWDKCIYHSMNRLTYGMSWWLDVVSPGWEALVQDDYVAVMPLTRKRRFGIDYLYQPYLTQQLGVFSANKPEPEVVDQFLDAIPEKIRYVDIHLNSMNSPLNHNFTYSARNNYTLEMTRTYVHLLAGYHRNCRRNLQKAVQAGLEVKSGPSPKVFTSFVERNLDKQVQDMGNKICPVIREITQASIQQGVGEIKGVYKPNGKLVAAGWFIYDMGRCIFGVCASTREGRKNQSMYLLVDHVIENRSGKGEIFDFTGSNIPGVAYFNAGFGAVKSTYLAAQRNLLPWPLSLMK
ncbi:MAG: hypothetical protein JXA72_04915 [Bacteroidales bacterium]|nr:hypothetical protein [Bacteroidales bacterium]